MYTSEIKCLFGKNKPTVTCFNRLISGLTDRERECWKESIFITTLCYYADKNKAFRAFIDHFTDSHRQEFLEYILLHTMLGKKRYELGNEGSSLLLKIIVAMENCKFFVKKENIL